MKSIHLPTKTIQIQNRASQKEYDKTDSKVSLFDYLCIKNNDMAIRFVKLAVPLVLIMALSYALPSRGKTHHDLMLTRNGSFYEVKIEKIGKSKLTYINLNHPKWGKLKTPTNYVYAVLRENGNHLFFDEKGDYSSVVEGSLNLEGDILFLNNHKFFPVYQVQFIDGGLVYKLSNDTRATLYQIERSKVFMLKKADKSVVLFDDKNGCGKNAVMAPASAWQLPAPRSDVAASVFSPDLGQEASSLANDIRAKNPYAVCNTTTMLEYQFQRGKYLEERHGVSYIRQKVADIKVQNGLLVTYVKQMVYDNNHRKARKVPEDYYDYLFPMEIDAKGNYFLTHNLVDDLMMIEQRKGYGVLITGDLQPGMHLPCGKMTIRGRSFSGKSITVEAEYRDWYVVREETMTTAAGTFNCMKLRGRISLVTNGGKPVVQKIACWMAKGIGMVCYDTLLEDSGEKVPLTLCLMRIQR